MVVRRQLKQFNERNAEKVAKDGFSLLPSATACLEDDCGFAHDKATSRMPRQAEARHVFKRYESYDGGASVETQSVVSDCTSPTRGWSSGEDLPANPEIFGDENPDLEVFGDLAWEVGDSTVGFYTYWDADSMPLNDISNVDMNPVPDSLDGFEDADTRPVPNSPSPRSPMPVWVSKLLDRAHHGDSAVKQAFFWMPPPPGVDKKSERKQGEVQPEEPQKQEASAGAASSGAADQPRARARFTSRGAKARPRSWDGPARTIDRLGNEPPRRAISRMSTRSRKHDRVQGHLPDRQTPSAALATEVSQPLPCLSGRPTSRQIRQPPGLSRQAAPAQGTPARPPSLSGSQNTFSERTQSDVDDANSLRALYQFQ
mmetsp:Transcript_125154/g.226949  ORF Transcript_125154/g.226949 Transcript_125154/m.226949 type:complete len:371 (-) Transcript_125154:46-1158(-)